MSRPAIESNKVITCLIGYGHGDLETFEFAHDLTKSLQDGSVPVSIVTESLKPEDIEKHLDGLRYAFIIKEADKMLARVKQGEQISHREEDDLLNLRGDYSYICEISYVTEEYKPPENEIKYYKAIYDFIVNGKSIDGMGQFVSNHRNETMFKKFKDRYDFLKYCKANDISVEPLEVNEVLAKNASTSQVIEKEGERLEEMNKNLTNKIEEMQSQNGGVIISLDLGLMHIYNLASMTNKIFESNPDVAVIPLQYYYKKDGVVAQIMADKIADLAYTTGRSNTYVDVETRHSGLAALSVRKEDFELLNDVLINGKDEEGRDLDAKAVYGHLDKKFKEKEGGCIVM